MRLIKEQLHGLMILIQHFSTLQLEVLYTTHSHAHSFSGDIMLKETLAHCVEQPAIEPPTSSLPALPLVSGCMYILTVRAVMKL